MKAAVKIASYWLCGLIISACAVKKTESPVYSVEQWINQAQQKITVAKNQSITINHSLAQSKWKVSLGWRDINHAQFTWFSDEKKLQKSFAINKAGSYRVTVTSTATAKNSNQIKFQIILIVE